MGFAGGGSSATTAHVHSNGAGQGGTLDLSDTLFDNGATIAWLIGV